MVIMKNELEQQIDEILTRGVSEVINRENLKKRLLNGDKLRVKQIGRAHV